MLGLPKSVDAANDTSTRPWDGDAATTLVGGDGGQDTDTLAPALHKSPPTPLAAMTKQTKGVVVRGTPVTVP
jgi:hypothetical protein